MCTTQDTRYLNFTQPMHPAAHRNARSRPLTQWRFTYSIVPRQPQEVDQLRAACIKMCLLLYEVKLGLPNKLGAYHLFKPCKSHRLFSASKLLEKILVFTFYLVFTWYGYRLDRSIYKTDFAIWLVAYGPACYLVRMK
ncbi:uncharacterized protein F4812DRAFT_232020 [Daldinia caldariorum]|uniref:uncharacterized protein n=1 Tax=Daldinia caldariorum TaxID=326644 RepID=UPI002007B3AE|nr:uncharacterized protein F4812DRAFT_232020 [Daldinia caldariorum]KAI1463809.1 hypothetical protein F4812DRAFT_232020 [Daldinia caldariorum]